jgi:cardiolipin synthase
VLPELSAEMGEHLVAVLELDAKISRRQDLDDAPLKLYMLLSTHRRRRPYALRRARSMSTADETPKGGTNALTADPAGRGALELYTVEDPRALVAGHAVRLLRNGAETFPVWLAAIEAARARISLEMYIFSDDAIGRRFAAALAGAAHRGVEVRLLYDYAGCRNTPARFFTQMRAEGIHVIAYHKYRLWRPRLWTLIRRNHRKTLVCDGSLAFTGGLNISNQWVPAAEGGGDWHDAVVEVRGPEVATIEATFLRTWNRRARKKMRLKPAGLPHPPPAGDVSLAVVSNSELRDRFVIRRTALHAIRESRRRVLLANPYFVPDRGMLRALAEAVARGVDVRLLVPLQSDSRILDLAARAVFGPLLAAGVRIWRSHHVIHTKALAVDDAFVSVGSYNFDHRSLAYNLELVVNAVDRRITADVVAMLEADMAGCEELTRDGFARRSWLEQLLERIAYSLRQWL